MASVDATRGPLGRTLFALAWPVIAGEALHVSFHLVDIAWVRPLGAWATAAILTSMFTLWISLSLASLVATGIVAYVARLVGAGERDRAAHVVSQAILLAAGLSVAVTAAGVLGAKPLFRLLTDDAIVREAGAGYLATFALSTPFSFLVTALSAAMRACGNTRTPTRIQAAGLALNAALAPLFVFGIGPFPEWGVRGSAVASVIAMGLTFVAFAEMALRGHRDLPWSRASLRAIDLPLLRGLVHVGAPATAIGTLYSLVYLWYAHLAGGAGAVGMALLGIGNRLESVTYLTADGFGAATATLVGQNLGAGDRDRARRGAWLAVGIMAGFGLAAGLVMLAAPRALLLPFTADAGALALGAGYVRVLALCQVFTGVEGPIGGAFAGAGDTMPPMAIHVGFALIRFPLAWWVVEGLGLGVMGIAWTMCLTCIVRGVVLLMWMRRGAWLGRLLPGAAARIPAGDPGHESGAFAP